MKTCKVAVYGTLKSIHHNHNLMGPEAKIVASDVTLPGFALYHLGYYPGVRRDKNHHVVVEVVEVPVSVLTNLDAYEGYHPEKPEWSLFTREQIKLPDGERAFLYVYNRVPNEGASIIDDGVWLNV